MRSRVLSVPERNNSARRSDEGFTLIELTVAMTLIAVILSSLVGLQITALKGVGLAKQRQAATALSNQKIEQLRALPYDSVRLGLSSAKAANEVGYINSGRLRAPWNEKVVVNASQTAAALSQVLEVRVIDNVTYRTRTFVTHPRNADGTDSSSSVDFWFTVAVEWVSGLTNGQTKSVVVRTRAVYPAGCNGTVDHPYAGPCQAFHYATAGLTNASVNLSSANASALPFQGSAFQKLDLVLGGLSVTSQTEQTPSAQASLMSPGLLKDSVALVAQQVVTPMSDVDPATAAAGSPAVGELNAWTAADSNNDAGIGSVRAAFSSADGDAMAATAQDSAPACPDLASASTATQQPCAAAVQVHGGAARLALDLNGLNGRNLPEFALSTVTPGPQSQKAFGARYVTGTPNHCTGTSGSGCIAAGAARAVSAVSTGALPGVGAEDAVTPGFAGALVSLSSYADSATAEAGVAAATANGAIDAVFPTARRFGLSRSGTLRIWNGTGFTDVALGSLTTDQTYDVPEVVADYKAGGVTQVTLTARAQVKVARPAVEQLLPSGCQPSACTGKASAGSVVAQVTYRVITPSGTVAHFVVTTNLGTVTASTSYRGVPSA